jgi:hypothetical protein
MYVVLVAAIVAGLATTLLGATGGEEHNYRASVSPWFRSLFILQPDIASMAASSLAFKIHTLIGMLLFVVRPRCGGAHLAPRLGSTTSTCAVARHRGRSTDILAIRVQRVQSGLKIRGERA